MAVYGCVALNENTAYDGRTYGARYAIHRRKIASVTARSAVYKHRLIG